MRIVYDTNVAATILLRRGEMLKLKAAVTSGKFTVVTSVFILGELAEVLRLRLGITKHSARARLRAFIKIAQVLYQPM